MSVYVATFTGVAVSAAQDLFSLVSPSSGITVLQRCIISQTSDYKDAEDEGVPIVIERGATAAGSGGSSITPGGVDGMNAAYPTGSGAACRRNDTTRANTGTIVQLHAETWQVRDTWDYLPLPEHRLIISPSQRLVIALSSAPADALTVNGTLIFELIGG